MSDLFGFMNMMDNHEERNVKNYTKDEMSIDTSAVSDSDKSYETGIQHPLYNEGEWVIVELYDNKEEAESGHDKWVKIMTADTLPDSLQDVSTCAIAEISRALDKEGTYTNHKKEETK